MWSGLEMDLGWECYFCTSYFDSIIERELHEQNSHNMCRECRIIFDSWVELKAHCRKFSCAHVCEGCGQQGNLFFKPEMYERHVELGNVCPTCDKHFGTNPNLIHHELTHREPDYECLACNRHFTTYGGMIIHLESGACSSQTDELELATAAARCYQWAKYFESKNDREALIWGYDVLHDKRQQWGQVMFFRCPTCDHNFPKLSSLFMHVESPACNQQLDEGAIGKLQKYLRRTTLGNN
ncbi:hypothetical protein BDW02DRAFT_630228 [Decorospora gaudefroyi]|uniref:C2H2-type domain-containing protein n=1 Tax=Decorospora gaudefroyi TaxID=184978 RepID=A0A6A5KGH5_9PLEO|nr:hypothetical protein BDW02DRAFT_630228 [Decorospora gaudefroyi]